MAEPFAPGAAQHADASAFRIIPVGIDGFAARMELIGAAKYTLDLQYFIFQQDDSGRLLTDAMLRAADRGVHIRLLIDDGATGRGDGRISTLAAHPQIEVRVFNPFVYRGSWLPLRAAEFVLDHGRLDFRMHNKLFVADNAVALVGGRNIGDQYFQIDPQQQFADDDVFVYGPTVQRLSGRFDDYWNSRLAIPVEALAGGRPSAEALEEYRHELAAQRSKAEESGGDYWRRVVGGEPLAAILQGRAVVAWSTALVVCDSPDKKSVMEGRTIGRLMYEPVAKAVAAAKSEVLVTSPYLVPTAEELQLIKDLRSRQVKVRILTNSLDSTTELSAQSGYDRYRKSLLAQGVELYELRTRLGNSRGSGQSARMSRHGNYGLHAKLFVFDRQRLFAGSMNWDQRSRHLNTEIGLIIDSAELAQETAVRFEAMTAPDNAYRVELTPDRHGRPHLVWRTRENGEDKEYTREPSRSLGRKIAVGLLSLLPIGPEL